VAVTPPPHPPDDAGLRALRARRGTRAAELLEREPPWARQFQDLRFEWRRLFSETLGTFLLVTVAVGAGVVDHRSHGGVGRTAQVVAPGLMVTAIILFMGAVSGAHLNPVVSLAFALRRDFQWRRVPGYLGAQALGAAAGCLLLRATFGPLGSSGSTLPGPGFTTTQAFVVETLLTAGLVSVVLGTASTAQSIGPLAAFGVGAYIVLAGLWAGPVSGASMNPFRSLAPAIVAGHLHDSWIYLAGPTLGSLLAVAAAQVLRGPGGDPDGSKAAQGSDDDRDA
jgi:aquaporin Z